MKYSHEDYDRAIRRAIENARKVREEAFWARYDAAIKRALARFDDGDEGEEETRESEGGSDKHAEYDKAIKAAIESQRQYSHEDYDKAIAKALGVNGNKNKGEKNTENILTSVRKSDSLNKKINSDAEDDHITWVTIKGTHVPLDGDGNAVRSKGRISLRRRARKARGKVKIRLKRQRRPRVPILRKRAAAAVKP